MAIAQVLARHAKGAHVVRDFFDVVTVAELYACFLVEQIGQRCLGAFDLGTQQSFLADGAVPEPFSVVADAQSWWRRVLRRMLLWRWLRYLYRRLLIAKFFAR